MTAAWPKNMPRSLDYPNVGIDAVLEGAAHDYPDRLAYEHGDQSITYRALLDQARRVAGGLRARGIASGDVIAFHMPNSLSFTVVYYGTMLAGAAVAALNPAQPIAALRRQLESVAPKAIVTSESCATIAVEAAPASVEFLVGVPGDGELPAGVTPLSDLLAAEPLADVHIDPDQVAHLQMTGGTTGVSKAVLRGHRGGARRRPGPVGVRCDTGGGAGPGVGGADPAALAAGSPSRTGSDPATATGDAFESVVGLLYAVGFQFPSEQVVPVLPGDQRRRPRGH